MSMVILRGYPGGFPQAAVASCPALGAAEQNIEKVSTLCQAEKMNDIQYMNDYTELGSGAVGEGDLVKNQNDSRAGCSCRGIPNFSHILGFFFLDRTTCCVRYRYQCGLSLPESKTIRPNRFPILVSNCYLRQIEI
jgi:hypothetical protein